ncbi:ATPase_AAA_core domain-containing protein [Psidium guajava]|nr:ATPase_AAA_core domain-containing protein [Psidium guajava]
MNTANCQARSLVEYFGEREHFRFVAFPARPTDLSKSSSSSVSISGLGTSPTILKQNKPVRLDIPVSALNFAIPVTATRYIVAKEREEYGYSVYCKTGIFCLFVG